MGDIPERSLFRHPVLAKPLKGYFEIVQGTFPRSKYHSFVPFLYITFFQDPPLRECGSTPRFPCATKHTLFLWRRGTKCLVRLRRKIHPIQGDPRPAEPVRSQLVIQERNPPWIFFISATLPINTLPHLGSLFSLYVHSATFFAPATPSLRFTN